MSKRYFWLKLNHDFFDSKRIKKLRTISGGDTFVLIYLKMQLATLKTDGVLTFSGLEDDFPTELALDIDENAADVAVTLNYLLKVGLVQQTDETHYVLPFVVENTGSETASTQRWRDWKKRQEALKNEQSLLESNTSPTLCQHFANVETDTEKEKELELEIHLDNNYILVSERLTDKEWNDLEAMVKRHSAEGEYLGNIVELINAADESSKNQEIKNPYRYIVGIAKKWGWCDE